jgi:hypothetical protein
MHPIRWRRVGAILAILILFVAIVHVGRQRPPATSEVAGVAGARQFVLSTDTMEDESGEIFSGRVVDLRTDHVPGGPAIFTEVRIRTTNHIKGTEEPEKVLRVPGGRLGDDVTYVSHVPEFYLGEEVFLFAKPESQLGHLEVVGGEWGKLHVENGAVQGDGRDQPLSALVEEVRASAARRGRSLPATPLNESASSDLRPVAQSASSMGYRWSGSAGWYLNPTAPAGVGAQISTAQFQGAMSAAFQQWMNSGRVSVGLRGTTGAIPDAICAFDPVAPCQPDGLNTLGWVVGLPTGVLGRTVCFYNPQTGAAADCDIGFAANFPNGWSVTGLTSRFDLQSVGLHEEGHFLGLGHSADPSAIMYHSIGLGILKRTLAADDINGIQALYGAAAPSGPIPPLPGLQPRLRTPLIRH